MTNILFKFQKKRSIYPSLLSRKWVWYLKLLTTHIQTPTPKRNLVPTKQKKASFIKWFSIQKMGLEPEMKKRVMAWMKKKNEKKRNQTKSDSP